MDSEMSDGSPVSPEIDARMLADLRAWRARLDTGPTIIALTIDELDMFLRVAAERDALRRELVDMPDDHLAPVPVRSVPFTADVPDEVRERAESKPRDTDECRGCAEDIAGLGLYYCSACGKPRPWHVNAPCSVEPILPEKTGAVPESCAPRPEPRHEEGLCRYCGGMIFRRGGSPWFHAAAGGGLHLAEPIS